MRNHSVTSAHQDGGTVPLPSLVRADDCVLPFPTTHTDNSPPLEKEPTTLDPRTASEDVFTSWLVAVVSTIPAPTASTEVIRQGGAALTLSQQAKRRFIAREALLASAFALLQRAVDILSGHLQDLQTRHNMLKVYHRAVEEDIRKQHQAGEHLASAYHQAMREEKRQGPLDKYLIGEATARKRLDALFFVLGRLEDLEGLSIPPPHNRDGAAAGVVKRAATDPAKAAARGAAGGSSNATDPALQRARDVRRKQLIYGFPTTMADDEAAAEAERVSSGSSPGGGSRDADRLRSADTSRPATRDGAAGRDTAAHGRGRSPDSLFSSTTLSPSSGQHVHSSNERKHGNDDLRSPPLKHAAASFRLDRAMRIAASSGKRIGPTTDTSDSDDEGLDLLDDDGDENTGEEERRSHAEQAGPDTTTAAAAVLRERERRERSRQRVLTLMAKEVKQLERGLVLPRCPAEVTARLRNDLILSFSARILSMRDSTPLAAGCSNRNGQGEGSSSGRMDGTMRSLVGFYYQHRGSRQRGGSRGPSASSLLVTGVRATNRTNESAVDGAVAGTALSCAPTTITTTSTALVDDQMESFVEWYVNEVLDPFAVSQLLALVPPDYLVMTSCRLVNVCERAALLRLHNNSSSSSSNNGKGTRHDMHHQQLSRALPDLAHVMLRAIVEGRVEAFTLFATATSSVAFTSALSRTRSALQLFYTSLISGQLEVISRLCSLGFHHPQALHVLLFLQTDWAADDFCREYAGRLQRWVRSRVELQLRRARSSRRTGGSSSGSSSHKNREPSDEELVIMKAMLALLRDDDASARHHPRPSARTGGVQATATRAGREEVVATPFLSLGSLQRIRLFLQSRRLCIEDREAQLMAENAAMLAALNAVRDALYLPEKGGSAGAGTSGEPEESAADRAFRSAMSFHGIDAAFPHQSHNSRNDGTPPPPTASAMARANTHVEHADGLGDATFATLLQTKSLDSLSAGATAVTMVPAFSTTQLRRLDATTYTPLQPTITAYHGEDDAAAEFIASTTTRTATSDHSSTPPPSPSLLSGRARSPPQAWDGSEDVGMHRSSSAAAADLPPLLIRADTCIDPCALGRPQDRHYAFSSSLVEEDEDEGDGSEEEVEMLAGGGGATAKGARHVHGNEDGNDRQTAGRHSDEIAAVCGPPPVSGKPLAGKELPLPSSATPPASPAPQSTTTRAYRGALLRQEEAARHAVEQSFYYEAHVSLEFLLLAHPHTEHGRGGEGCVRGETDDGNASQLIIGWCIAGDGGQQHPHSLHAAPGGGRSNMQATDTTHGRDAVRGKAFGISLHLVRRRTLQIRQQQQQRQEQERTGGSHGEERDEEVEELAFRVMCHHGNGRVTALQAATSSITGHTATSTNSDDGALLVSVVRGGGGGGDGGGTREAAGRFSQSSFDRRRYHRKSGGSATFRSSTNDNDSSTAMSSRRSVAETRRDSRADYDGSDGTTSQRTAAVSEDSDSSSSSSSTDGEEVGMEDQSAITRDAGSDGDSQRCDFLDVDSDSNANAEVVEEEDYPSEDEEETDQEEGRYLTWRQREQLYRGATCRKVTVFPRVKLVPFSELDNTSGLGNEGDRRAARIEDIDGWGESATTRRSAGKQQQQQQQHSGASSRAALYGADALAIGFLYNPHSDCFSLAINGTMLGEVFHEVSRGDAPHVDARGCRLYPAASLHVTRDVVECLSAETRPAAFRLDYPDSLQADAESSDGDGETKEEEGWVIARELETTTREAGVIRFAFDADDILFSNALTPPASASEAAAQRSLPSQPSDLHGGKKGMQDGARQRGCPRLLDGAYKLQQILTTLAPPGSQRTTASSASRAPGHGGSPRGTISSVPTTSHSAEPLAHHGNTSLLRVQLMLNQACRGGLEDLFFFPPVYIRRRSDDALCDFFSDITTTTTTSSSSSSGGGRSGSGAPSRGRAMAIIPEGARLTPLCAAIAARRPDMAFAIASHPLSDFYDMQEDSVRARRMALLAACALGYAPVLQVLLERMPVEELLEPFGIRVQHDALHRLRREHRRRNVAALADYQKRLAANSKGCASASRAPITNNTEGMYNAHRPTDNDNGTDIAYTALNVAACPSYYYLASTAGDGKGDAASTERAAMLDVSVLYSVHRSDCTPLHAALLGCTSHSQRDVDAGTSSSSSSSSPTDKNSCVTALLNFLTRVLAPCQRARRRELLEQKRRAVKFGTILVDDDEDGDDCNNGERSNNGWRGHAPVSRGAAGAARRKRTSQLLQDALNLQTRAGESALLIAVRHSNVPVALRLLSLGANPTCMDRLTRALSLEIACANNCLVIAKALLRHEAFYTSPVLLNHAGVATPLCWCAVNGMAEMVPHLLRLGADPRIGLEENPPLLLAIAFGSQEAAKALLHERRLALSASRQRQERQQQQQEEQASRKPDALATPAATALLIDVNVADTRSSSSALHMACELGHVEVAKLLLAMGAAINATCKPSHHTPLHTALLHRQEAAAMALLTFGKDRLRCGEPNQESVLDIAAIDAEGDTALHIAARQDMTHVVEYMLVQFSKEEMLRIVSLRPSRGGDGEREIPSAPCTLINKAGRTPLMAAIQAGAVDTALLMVSLAEEEEGGMPNREVSDPSSSRTSEQLGMRHSFVGCGGPVVEGTCVALLQAASGGLDDVVLAMLVVPRTFPASSGFREAFMDLYNAHRRQLDRVENANGRATSAALANANANGAGGGGDGSSSGGGEHPPPQQRQRNVTVESPRAEDGDEEGRREQQRQSLGAKRSVFSMVVRSGSGGRLARKGARAAPPHQQQVGECFTRASVTARVAGSNLSRTSVAFAAARARSRSDCTRPSSMGGGAERGGRRRGRREAPSAARRPRRSSFVRLLLARGRSEVDPAHAIRLLLRGFALPELYIMLEEVAKESTIVGIQNPTAMVYGEGLVGFLEEHCEVSIAPSKTVAFCKEALKHLQPWVAPMTAAVAASAPVAVAGTPPPTTTAGTATAPPGNPCGGGIPVVALEPPEWFTRKEDVAAAMRRAPPLCQDVLRVIRLYGRRNGQRAIEELTVVVENHRARDVAHQQQRQYTRKAMSPPSTAAAGTAGGGGGGEASESLSREGAAATTTTTTQEPAPLREADFTSPFGYTALQLCASLGLADVASFLLRQYDLSPLFAPWQQCTLAAQRSGATPSSAPLAAAAGTPFLVSPADAAVTARITDAQGATDAKWMWTPYRLATRSQSVATVLAFLACAQPPRPLASANSSSRNPWSRDSHGAFASDFVDYKEPVEVDPTQRTALQETLACYVDIVTGFKLGGKRASSSVAAAAALAGRQRAASTTGVGRSSASLESAMAIGRLLLSRGAAISGRFDVYGMDAWLLAVSADGKAGSAACRLLLWERQRRTHTGAWLDISSTIASATAAAWLDIASQSSGADEQRESFITCAPALLEVNETSEGSGSCSGSPHTGRSSSPTRMLAVQEEEEAATATTIKSSGVLIDVDELRGRYGTLVRQWAASGYGISACATAACGKDDAFGNSYGSPPSAGGSPNDTAASSRTQKHSGETSSTREVFHAPTIRLVDSDAEALLAPEHPCESGSADSLAVNGSRPSAGAAAEEVEKDVWRQCEASDLARLPKEEAIGRLGDGQRGGRPAAREAAARSIRRRLADEQQMQESYFLHLLFACAEHNVAHLPHLLHAILTSLMPTGTLAAHRPAHSPASRESAAVNDATRRWQKRSNEAQQSKAEKIPASSSSSLLSKLLLAVHPLTGDTLLTFVLKCSHSRYTLLESTATGKKEEEDMASRLLAGTSRANLSVLMAEEGERLGSSTSTPVVGSNNVAANQPQQYTERDPLSVPAVRRFVEVAVKLTTMLAAKMSMIGQPELLNRFLYHMANDGESALSIAARIGCMPLIGFVVCPPHPDSLCSVEPAASTPSHVLHSAYSGRAGEDNNKISADTSEAGQSNTSNLRGGDVPPPSVRTGSDDDDDDDDFQDTSAALAPPPPPTREEMITANLASTTVRTLLATRVYYTEEYTHVLYSILTCVPHNPERLDFLGRVYPNVHPIPALQLAAENAAAARLFLVPNPAASNAFWGNVLYAQYVDRLNDLPVASAVWSTLLRTMLPSAPAVAVYLLKKGSIGMLQSASRQRGRREEHGRSQLAAQLALQRQHRETEALTGGGSSSSRHGPPSRQSSSSPPMVAAEDTRSASLGLPAGPPLTARSPTPGRHRSRAKTGKGDRSNWIFITRRVDIFLRLMAFSVAHTLMPHRGTAAATPTPGIGNTLLEDVVELAIRYDDTRTFHQLITLTLSDNVLASFATAPPGGEGASTLTSSAGTAATNAHAASLNLASVRACCPTLLAATTAAQAVALLRKLQAALWRNLVEDMHVDLLAVAAGSIRTLACLYTPPATATIASTMPDPCPTSLMSVLRYDRIDASTGLPEGMAATPPDTQKIVPPQQPMEGKAGKAAPTVKVPRALNLSSPGSRGKDKPIGGGRSRPTSARSPQSTTSTASHGHARQQDGNSQEGESPLSRSTVATTTSVGAAATAEEEEAAFARICVAGGPLSGTAATAAHGNGNAPSLLANHQQQQQPQGVVAGKRSAFVTPVTWGVGAATVSILGQTGEARAPWRQTLQPGERALEPITTIANSERVGSARATRIHFVGSSSDGGSDDEQESLLRQQQQPPRAAALLTANSNSNESGNDAQSRRVGSARASARERTTTQDEPAKTSPAAHARVQHQQQPEPERYPKTWFMYLLGDWALHSTIVLQSPRPSASTLDVVLFLLNRRAPLSVSVLQLFLAASHPTNAISYQLSPLTQGDGMSSQACDDDDGDGSHHTNDNNNGEQKSEAAAAGAEACREQRQLSLAFESPAHADSLLHILVMNDQCQLAEYYLAFCLFYFAQQEAGEPTTRPGLFDIHERGGHESGEEEEEAEEGHRRTVEEEGQDSDVIEFAAGDPFFSAATRTALTPVRKGTEKDISSSSSRSRPIQFLRLMLRRNRHGLTPFDYAHSPGMLLLLQNYGCVPPSYRPNPRTFSRALGLPVGGVRVLSSLLRKQEDTSPSLRMRDSVSPLSRPGTASHSACDGDRSDEWRSRPTPQHQQQQQQQRRRRGSSRGRVGNMNRARTEALLRDAFPFFPVPRIVLASENFAALQDGDNADAVYRAVDALTSRDGSSSTGKGEDGKAGKTGDRVLGGKGKGSSSVMRRRYLREKLALFHLVTSSAGGHPRPAHETTPLLTGAAPILSDAALLRNLLASQRSTMNTIFPILLNDDVSLLHLGLCAADDELVLVYGNHQHRQDRKDASAVVHPVADAGGGSMPLLPHPSSASAPPLPLSARNNLQKSSRTVDGILNAAGGADTHGGGGPASVNPLAPTRVVAATGGQPTSLATGGPSLADVDGSGADSVVHHRSGYASHLLPPIPLEPGASSCVPSRATSENAKMPVSDRDGRAGGAGDSTMPSQPRPPTRRHAPPVTQQQQRLHAASAATTSARAVGSPSAPAPPPAAVVAVSATAPSLSHRGIIGMLEQRHFVVFPLSLPPPAAAAAATTMAPPPPEESRRKAADRSRLSAGGGNTAAESATVFLQKMKAQHVKDAEEAADEAEQVNEAALLVALTPMQLAIAAGIMKGLHGTVPTSAGGRSGSGSSSSPAMQQQFMSIWQTTAGERRGVSSRGSVRGSWPSMAGRNRMGNLSVSSARFPAAGEEAPTNANRHPPATPVVITVPVLQPPAFTLADAAVAAGGAPAMATRLDAWAWDQLMKLARHVASTMESSAARHPPQQPDRRRQESAAASRERQSSKARSSRASAAAAPAPPQKRDPRGSRSAGTIPHGTSHTAVAATGEEWGASVDHKDDKNEAEEQVTDYLSSVAPVSGVATVEPQFLMKLLLKHFSSAAATPTMVAAPATAASSTRNGRTGGGQGRKTATASSVAATHHHRLGSIARLSREMGLRVEANYDMDSAGVGDAVAAVRQLKSGANASKYAQTL